MPYTVANDYAASDAAFWCEQGLGLIAIPCVGCVLPALSRVLDEPGLSAFLEFEFLPEARADRKLPRVRIRRVDELAARQFHPTRLDRAVRPEGVLGRKQNLLRANALELPVGVESGLFERRCGPGVRDRPGEACKRTGEQQGSQNKLFHRLLVCSGGSENTTPELGFESVTNPNRGHCRLIAR